MKFFLFLDKHKVIINICTLFIVCLSVGISVYCFENDYWGTDWHWAISFFGGVVMFTATFILKDEDE